jgi:hypothetical protein
VLIQEARWFAARLAELDDHAIAPMLNVGSHTAEFRAKDQPWIDRLVFAPVRARGVAVTHLDMRAGAGVDLVGDLADPAFSRRVASMRFRSVFAANILEHVVDPASVARLILTVIPPGGYVFVSCPFRFPYHPDPIDTMFRPDPGTLAGLFPGATLLRGDVISAGTLLTYLLARARQNPRALAASVLRRAAGRGTSQGAGLPPHLLPWMLRRFRETCLVLRKQA